MGEVPRCAGEVRAPLEIHHEGRVVDRHEEAKEDYGIVTSSVRLGWRRCRGPYSFRDGAHIGILE